MMQYDAHVHHTNTHHESMPIWRGGDQDRFVSTPRPGGTAARLIEACQNVAISGERRTGKTSLIFETGYRKTCLPRIELAAGDSGRL